MPKTVDDFNKSRLRSSNITVVISISLVLFLVGLFGLILINAQKYSDYIKEQLVVEAYFDEYLDPRDSAKTLKFQEETFAKMKPGSCLVHTARGKIVDTEALIQALATGKLAGAALDALEDEEKYFSVGWEKNPYYSRLMAIPNVMITPHIAYHTELAVQEIVETSLTNARDIIIAGSCRNTISL